MCRFQKATQEKETVCMPHVKTSILTSDYALPAIANPPMCKTSRFQSFLSWLEQLATSNFSHVSQIRTVLQFLPVCVAERRCLREAIGLEVTSAVRGLVTKAFFDTLLSSAAFLLVD